MAVPCPHVDMIHVTRPDKRYCEDCVTTGDRWVQLRMCLICGHVACCDSSPNQHASRHFQSTGHPLMRSAESNERWTWCYVDEVSIGELPA